MKRLLFVIHYPVFGGPYNQALRLAEPLAKRGFETVVVVPEDAHSGIERLRTAGIAVRPIALHRLRATRDVGDHFALLASAPREIRRLKSIIQREHIDLVQLGGLVNPHAAIAARLAGIPVVWQLIDTRAPWPIAAASMLLVDALADIVMSTGLAVAEAHPRFRQLEDRVIPFFPPVDIERFAPRPGDRAAVRASWGISTDRVVVGSVANINPQKGIIELVRAFGQARRLTKRSNVVLVLVGEEHGTHRDYSDLVRAEIKAASLVEGRDVVFAGGRTDVELQLAGMDVFALAAVPRSEGITTAVLEAMAAGIPPVVTDVGALREAIEDGRSGLLVPASDTDAFAVALGSLLENEDRRTRIAVDARRRAERVFGLDTSAAAHIAAYERALRSRRRH